MLKKNLGRFDQIYINFRKIKQSRLNLAVNMFTMSQKVFAFLGLLQYLEFGYFETQTLFAFNFVTFFVFFMIFRFMRIHVFYTLVTSFWLFILTIYSRYLYLLGNKTNHPYAFFKAGLYQFLLANLIEYIFNKCLEKEYRFNLRHLINIDQPFLLSAIGLYFLGYNKQKLDDLTKNVMNKEKPKSD